MSDVPAWAAHLPEGVDADTLDLTAAGSLPARWAATWRRHPDHPTIHDGAAGWVTASDLDAASARAAARLRGAGLAPGDRVLSSAASSIDLVVAHVACLRAGLVVIPTNTAYRAGEIAHVITDAQPRAAIVDDAERAGWITDADASVLVLGPALDLADGPPVELDVSRPSDPALIGYTSGTTGRPKGAVLSHVNVLASVEALLLAWRWTSADRLVLSLPLFHMHGLGVGLHGTLAAGASAVLLDGFDADAVLDAAADHDATLFFGVPTMYRRLLDHPRSPELGRLRLCVSGSAPLPASIHREFEALTGQRILERYGMTETVMLVSNPYDGERRPGTVGHPLPGVELRLEGEPAEIQVRGPNVFEGYLDRPDANAEAFVDGWFRTGDLGHVDDDGYVTIAGRGKELVISGGYNVYPREVEDAVLGHEAVREVAVTGTPDDEWGEVVTAWVVSDRPIEAAELRTALADLLAPYKQPRIVHRVDELPRNALGKIQKHLLG